MFTALVARTLLPQTGHWYFRELLFLAGAPSPPDEPPPAMPGFPAYSLFDDEVAQFRSWICKAPPDSGIIPDVQIPFHSRVPESLVVIGPAPAAIFHTGLNVPQMDHLMEQRGDDVLDRPVQCPCAEVELVPLFLAALPGLAHCHMTVGLRCTLDRDDRLFQIPIKVTVIECPKHLLQIPGCSAGLYGLFHISFLLVPIGRIDSIRLDLQASPHKEQSRGSWNTGVSEDMPRKPLDWDAGGENKNFRKLLLVALTRYKKRHILQVFHESIRCSPKQ